MPRLGAVFWITALILVAALGLYFAPPHWLSLAEWQPTTAKRPSLAATPVVTAPAAPSSAVAPPDATPESAGPAPLEVEPTPPGAEPIPRDELPAAPAAAASR
jgi:hypothetical protein